MGILHSPARLARRAVPFTLGLMIAASAILACDTPVYRYAMYRWLPAPYEVYYFHNGELDDAGAKMKEAIDQLGEAEEARANIVFLPVNLEKDQDLTGVPPDVKEAWLKQESPIVPAYLISSPVGVHLRLGQLSVEELPALVDSPKRQQIGDLLGAGSAGVYIFLEGENAEANAEAEKVLRGVVDDVGAGKVELYSLPPMGYGFGQPGEDAADGDASGEEAAEEENPYKLALGLLTLTRDEAKEKALIDCLLALAPDLRESKEPIVFLIYGRGRALFSCLGKGIHRDNLIQDIEFVTGACSCTVKEQNPGVDLLMCYDWDAAAEKLSQQYGAEEGSAYEFGGDALFPELIIPPEGEMGDQQDTESTDVADNAIAQVDPDTTPDSQPEETSQSEAVPAESTTAEAEKTAAKKPDDPPGDQVALNTSSDDLSDSAEADSRDSSLTGIVWVGAGLLGALVVLFGATFLVLRPK